MTDQRQEGGRESTNIQAGRDITVSQGPSVEEVREIALDVFHRNFLQLQGLAEDVARGRAEKITNEFLKQLQDRNPAALESSKDPDMQLALFSAQREYARSGDADLEQVLVDLLVDRASEQHPGLRTIVLNEAITAAPKLTEDQRRAVALCFLVRYTRWTGAASVDAFYEERIRQGLMPLVHGLPTSPAAYQHIEYVGAGSVDIGSTSIEEALHRSARGWFTRGFTESELDERLHRFTSDETFFMPCMRDESRLQLRASSADDVDAIASAMGDPSLAEPVQAALNVGAMTSTEIREDLLSHVPEAGELLDAWDGSDLNRLTLTTVGIAVGHGYWRRVTGKNAALKIWIPD
jgi:hypothetical protein